MASSARLAGQAVSAAATAGLLEPGLLAALTASASFWGPTMAMPYAAAAMRYPFRTALIDDHGSLGYRQLHRRTNAVAAALHRRGVDARSTVGILCRNHRGFVEANIAFAKLGCRVVYLNTGMAPGQLTAVIEREGIQLIAADREFVKALQRRGTDTVIVAPEDDPDWSFPDLDRNRRLNRLPTPTAAPETIILTSGTTGVPKGARRAIRAGDAAGSIGMLQALPYRRGNTMVVAAPLFHAWGLGQHAIAASLAGTVVLRRHFDADQVLHDATTHRAHILVVVPAMLHRLLDSTSPVRLDRLKAVISSGAPLTATLATDWMDRHGDTLYNFYGSTEVGQVSIANPSDLRAAPGTAGRAAPGVDLRVLDANDTSVPADTVGRIVVAGSAQFDGYTGGGTKPVDDGYMEIGDTGRINRDGRLFITGRIDDMIISGGENLYPAGIEEALLEHAAVAQVAVVGVPDEDLGQRVRAVVVVARGAKKPTVAALRKHAKSRLANYEVPREFVFVKALPRNETGKILRRELMQTR